MYILALCCLAECINVSIYPYVISWRVRWPWLTGQIGRGHGWPPKANPKNKCVRMLLFLFKEVFSSNLSSKGHTDTPSCAGIKLELGTIPVAVRTCRRAYRRQAILCAATSGLGQRTSEGNTSVVHSAPSHGGSAVDRPCRKL